MSAKLMGQVFDLALDRDEFPIMIALADHAHDDGTSVYPSIGFLAWKTNLSERSVQRILRKLESKGLVEATDRLRGGRSITREYVIHIDKGVKKSPFNGRKGAKSSPIQPSVKDDSASPIVGEGVTSTTEKGDIHDIEKGDTHVTPLKGTISIEPSVELVDAPASHPRRVRSSARKSDLRDGIYNAIIECWHPGQTWQDLTKSEQSLIGKIASELVEVGATAEQVPRAWQAWPRLYPRAGKCTPPTLAKHWNELVKVDAVTANGIDPERYEKRTRPDGTVGYYER